ncbi:hypothetical protein [Streptomyces sp. NPDC001719]
MRITTCSMSSRRPGFRTGSAIARRRFGGSPAAGKENRAAFNTGQRQVDNLVLEWGRKNGYESNDGLVRHLVGSGQERHDSARNEAFIALDREK